MKNLVFSALYTLVDEKQKFGIMEFSHEATNVQMRVSTIH